MSDPYAGRLVDLAAFQTNGSQDMLIPELVGAANGGLLIAGPEKLAQKVLITLLTPLGSKQYDKTFGTNFMRDFRAGRWRTANDVSQSFYAARFLVALQLRNEETAADPLDERYGLLTLTSVILDGDTVQVEIELTDASGAVSTLLVPLTAQA